MIVDYELFELVSNECGRLGRTSRVTMYPARKMIKPSLIDPATKLTRKAMIYIPGRDG